MIFAILTRVELTLLWQPYTKMIGVIILPSFRSIHRVCPSLLILILITLSSTFISPINAQKLNSCNHGGGLWGTVVDSIEPINETIQNKYNSLSDRGRFITGACVGFTASRVIVGTTMKTIKTMGCVYIAFEALEYCGLLKEARREENKQLIAQSRDYVLRSVDSIRHDVRTQLHPSKISSRVKRSMKKDKPGTVGFGTGAFLGFAL